MFNMQNYFLPITTFLFIATCGISCAQDIPAIPPLLSSQVSTKTSSSLYEFEGRYKVGNTTCIVAPIKMAFEVKWTKGKGVMTFFFDKTTSDGKAIFVSEQLSKGRDKFVFDDDRYNVGVFIRADGKVFTVEKLRNERGKALAVGRNRR
jgi:hypothetical protein